MACVPPYCLGTGGWCGCNCKCCPPSPCYSSWTYTYECGTLFTEWYSGGGPDLGCTCIFAFRAPSAPIEFPDFNYRLLQEDENGFVFAQAGAPGTDPACIIPCATHNIVLSYTGCCLYGSGFSFVTVGSGTATLSPCPTTTCGNFTCDINGGGSSVTVGDCTTLTITITPPAINCCSCCFTHSAGTLHITATKAFTSQRNVETGVKRTFLNKQALLSKVQKIRQSRQSAVRPS
jgi:hypothetical protein